MENKKIVIVILNFMNYQDTKECIDSILKQQYADYHVLIVDNGSSNESYSYLKNMYKKNDYVSVIKTRKNYGFAKGNNIGICYAKNKFQAEYIMLLNSDTILQNPLYIKKILENDESGVGVIGSRIVLLNNSSMKKIYRYVTFPSTWICYLKILCEYMGFYELQKILEYKLSEYKGDYILPGCMLLLTPSYFQVYDNLDSRTFLYCEEELLYLRCKRVGLKQKLVEELSLFHKIGRSSEVLYHNKINIYNRYLLNSYKFVLWESIKDIIRKYYLHNIKKIINIRKR